MKLLFAGILFACLLATNMASAQSNTDTNSAATKEFSALEQKIRTKVQQGVRTERELAPELKEFDAILEKCKAQKTEDVANILLMKAQLYLQVFDDTIKGAEIVQQLQREFPETKPGRAAFLMLEAINQQENAKRIQGSLIPGAQFPEFDEKALSGRQISLKNLKGKVVLVDFWASWSEGWQKTLPGLLEAHSKYRGRGFVIVGVGLDEDLKKAGEFAKEQKMVWEQFVDGHGWKNKIAARCGVHRLPSNYLLDGAGKIIARNLSGKELQDAIGKALPAK